MSDFKRIVISETDATTVGYTQDVTDIVYIPGFAAPTNVGSGSASTVNPYDVDHRLSDNEYTVYVDDVDFVPTSIWEWGPADGSAVYRFKDGDTIANLATNEVYEYDNSVVSKWKNPESKVINIENPEESYTGKHTYTSTSSFKGIVGTEPAMFESDIAYTSDFAEGSYATSNYLINKGDYDKSYIEALQIIGEGMPVMYEILNTNWENISLIGSSITKILTKTTSNTWTAYSLAKALNGRDGEGWPINRATNVSIDLGDLKAGASQSSTLRGLIAKAIGSDGESVCDTMALIDDITGDVASPVTLGAPENERITKIIFDGGEEVENAQRYENTSSMTLTMYDNDTGIVTTNAEPICVKGNLPSTANDLYDKISNSLDELIDAGNFAVKYITTGGYPAFEYNSNSIVNKMLTVAALRGDAVALIDHTNYRNRALTGDSSVYGQLQHTEFEPVTITVGGIESNLSNAIDMSVFGSMFTPWATYKCNRLPETYARDGSDIQSLPASYAYLISLAKSIKTNANWLAVAGTTRGQVPYIRNLLTKQVLSNVIADSYQKRDEGICLNAITNIKPYGLTIWGNRTLKNNGEQGGLTATSFLNIRNLVCDVKKRAYIAAKTTLFEQNNDILWINFCSKITPLLSRMSTGAGIEKYKILKVTNDPADEGVRARLRAKIILYPVYALEDIYIDVVLTDDDVEVQ